jgi:signal peptidase I
MDFALIMLLLLSATGLVWGVDRWLWAGKRERAAQALEQAGKKKEAAQARKEPVYVEYARAFFPVILVVFLIRSFLVEPFRIPSGSMMPNLFNGDFILVNKYRYGIRLPVVNVKLVEVETPKRGEVAVFRFPLDPSTNYIKRIVGVPGDHIVYRGKRLYINGKLMEQTDSRPYAPHAGSEPVGEARRAAEHIDGIKHDILTTDRSDFGAAEFTVPPGHYFAMGDNRDHSNDSRIWGFVPDENLVGRAFLIWFSWDMVSPNKWFWERVVWSRIGNSIH